MNEIIISVQNWNRVSDQDVLRVVKAAIQRAIKYENERERNKHHYWYDPDKRVELQITFK